MMKTFISYSTDDCDSTELCITDLYVEENDRGKGKGRELVEEALLYAKENNYKKVGLWASPTSDEGLDASALIEFYRSCGFQSHGDCDVLMTYDI